MSMRKILTGFVAVLVAALLVAGCSKGEGGGKETGAGKVQTVYSPTPEAQVEGFLRHVNAGEYEKAAAYLNNGLEMWQSSPSMVKTSIDGIYFLNQKPVTVTLSSQSVRKADTAKLVYRFEFADGSPGFASFDLVKREKGWIIVSF